MMKKIYYKIFYFLLLLLLVPKVMAIPLIDISKSYAIPRNIGPNTEATLFIAITNPYEYTLSSLDIKFESNTQCIKILSDDEWELGTLYPHETKVIPLRIRTGDCEYNIYWLKASIDYNTPLRSEETEEYYPIMITEFPKLIIKNVETVPSYPKSNEKVELKFTLKNEGRSTLKNIRVILMNTNCAIILSPNTKLISNLGPNSSQTVTFNIKTTNIPCQIPVSLVYQDWAGNIYNETKVIGFDVYPTTSIISIDNLIINNLTAGKFNKITLRISNEGQKTLRNVVIKIVDNIKSPISFEQEEFFFNDIPKYYTADISTNVYINPDAAGIYKIPIIVYYTDDSGRLFNTTFYLTLKVVEKPKLIVYLSDISSDRITISVANVGNVKARNIYVVLYKGSGYRINGKNIEFIGDLDEGDYDTADFDVNILSSFVDIRGKVVYQDLLGNVYSKDFDLKATVPTTELPVPIETQSENKYYGIISLLIFVIAGLVIVLWRKHKKHAD